jgi:hypothetical protein
MKRPPTLAARLVRMQRMFDKSRALLAEDYNHFAAAAVPMPRASTPPSKAVRKSAARSGRRAPRRS